jgi:hypothetical protein
MSTRFPSFLATNSVEIQSTAINALSATSQAAHKQLQDLDGQMARQLEP